MRNYFNIVLIIIVLVGCSAQRSITSDENEKIVVTDNSADLKKKALEYFIDGSIAELNNKVAEAVLEYQEALRLDPQAGIHFALGRNYLLLNKLRSALDHAKSAVEKDPENSEYRFLLAMVYTAAHQIDSATVAYERLISIDSTNFQAYYNLAFLYEKDKPIRALSIYKKMLDLIGPQWNVLVKIADLNERMGNVDETIKSVEGLLKLNPSNLDLQKILIESYLKSQKFEKAVNLIEEAMVLFPDDENLIEYRASAYIQSGKWKEGADEYTKLIEKENIPFDSKLRIGIAFFTQSRKDTALLNIAKEIFEKIDKDSLDYQVKIYLGEIAIQQNDDSTAIENFRIASKLAEWNPEVWMRLGGLLFDSQRFSEAAEEMKKAIVNFPDDFVLNIYLGLSLSQENKHLEALPYLKKSVELNASDFTALSAYGFSLNQIGDNDEALIYLNKALNLDQDNISLLGIVGLIYDGKEMWAKSDSIYEKALQVDSNEISILNNYAYSLSERGIRLEEALEMVEKSVEADPENSSYLDTIGWVYYKLENYEMAKNYIEKALELNPQSATLSDHLGDIYFKLGVGNKALELWKQAYELDSSRDEIKDKIEKGIL